MPFTEANYENAVLQLFTQTLGYSYAYGPGHPAGLPLAPV